MEAYDTSWTQKKHANLRDYTNIYVTSNVDDPIGDSIKLGYTSDIEDIVFYKDSETFFHFPLKETTGYDNTFKSIHDTTIINDGATYGSCPYKSDRIYKKLYDYQDTSPYGRSMPTYKDNGKWLCTWLSGDVLSSAKDPPKWMDRWFDPSRLQETEALMADASDSSGSVFDVESELTFDYGAYYKYYRVGEKQIRKIDESIDTGNTMHIRLNDWLDDSRNGKITYLNPSEESFNSYKVCYDFDDNDYAVTFNGKNQLAIIPFDDNAEYKTNKEYSIVYWAKCDDWKNCTSYSIVDNAFVGGWKFGITNRANNSYIFAFGNDANNSLQNGTVLLFNTHGELVTTKAFWKTDDSYNIVDMISDVDLFSYVLTVEEVDGIYNSVIYKIDFNGNRILTLKIENSNLRYLDLSNEENGYRLYAYSADVCYSINRYDFTYDKVGISAVDGTGGKVVGIKDEYFITDKKNIFVADNANDTNDGHRISGTDKKYYVIDDPKDEIISCVCDYNNDVWVLKSDHIEKFGVVYHTYRHEFDFPIKKGIDPVCVDMISRNVNGKNVDYILVSSESKQCIYVYDTSGNAIDQYDTSRFYVVPCNRRRLTIYDWYVRNRSMTNCIYFDVFDANGHHRIKKSLDEVSDREWHQFAAVVRNGSEDGKFVAEFYFDCQKVGEKEMTGILQKTDSGSSVYHSTGYSYDSPIILGGRCGKIFPLAEEARLDNANFAGSLDDFRIYNRAIGQEDLYYIYMSKFMCDDLIWHFQTDRKNFVENIERFYKFKMPGSKSSHYELHLRGYRNIDGTIDEKLKQTLEELIKKALRKLTPVYSSLIKIVWD